MSDLTLTLMQAIGAVSQEVERQRASAINLIWTVGALAAAFIVLLFLQLKTRAASETLLQRVERLLLAMVFLAGIAIGGLAILYAAGREHRWGILLALLPYLLIMQHAMFLRSVRRPALKPLKGAPARSPGYPVPPDDDLPVLLSNEPERGSDTDWWRMVLKQASTTTDRYFGAVSLATRYGTAALMVLLVGLTAFLVLFMNDKSEVDGLLPTEAVHAARLGLAGAYVYVVIYLGRRNFTHDVTSGGAIWCSLVLAIGPILAATLSYLLHASPGAEPGDSFGVNLVYFIAGFSPRLIISSMEDVAKKKWGSAAITNAVSPRTLAITLVGGVTPDVAERLGEEGISDLHGLAMADPLRLIRNTNFDRREIVSWIDEAILIDLFPEHWKDFEREGVSGAIDFVSLVYPPPYTQYKADAEDKMRQERDSYLAVLCSHLKLSDKSQKPDATHPGVDDDVATIKSIARRLVNGAQLRLIWVLHNHIADEGVTDDGGAPQAAPAGGSSRTAAAG